MTARVIYGDEKPSLDDLMHYGVLGMKWGQTRKAAKATNKEITDARYHLHEKEGKIANAARKARAANKGSADEKKWTKKTEQLRQDYLKDPKRAIAVRATRGQKIVSGVLVGAGILIPGGLPIAVIGGAAAAAGVVGRSIISRRIERKQELKKYDK